MQDLMPAMQDLWQNLVKQFTATFITEQRYMLFLNGLKTTLTITFCAALLGIVLGFLIAYCRTTYERTLRRGPLLKFLNFLCNVYLTVIRGTPTMIQVLIMYFVIFGSVKIDKVPVAVLAFGMNSGAYVAEIFRGGIMSIDYGQMEAARSLGLNYTQATWRVILPQTIKNVFPSLGNELIVLLKETSISGYIAIPDLTKGGDLIRSQTYDAFLPLLGVAAIYLVLVMILTAGVHKLETRLRTNER